MKISKNTVIIGLIVLNIGVVSFFLLIAPRPFHDEPKKQIIKKLDLNKDQILKFEELVKSHKQKARSLHEEIRRTKKIAYRNILDEEQSQDSILNELGKKLVDVDRHNIQHLLKVKEILNEDQIPAFEELLKHIDRVFHPGPPRHHRPIKK